MTELFKTKIARCGFLLVFNLCFLIGVLQFVPLMFDSTDDVAMCYIANGHFFGASDPHLVYINAIYGEILCALYSHIPEVEWYSIFLLFLQLVAFSVIEYYVLKNIRSVYLKIVLLCFCLLTWLKFIVGFQYTTTSGVLCLAGCLLLIGKHWDSRSLGIVLITIASLLRFNMAAFVGVVFSPVFFYTYKKDFKQYIYVLCLCLVVLGCKYFDKLYYNSSDWSTYMEYNQLRIGINDNPNSGVLFNLTSDSISHNDALMILGTEQDPSILDCSTLEELNEEINVTTRQSKFLKIYQLKFFIIPLLLLGFFSLLFVCSSKGNIRWLLFACFCIFCLVLSLLSIHRFLKPRAVNPVIVTMVMIFAYCYNIEANKSYNKLLLTSMIAMCLGFIAIYSVETIQIGKKWNEFEDRWNSQKEMIAKHDNKALWPSDLCEVGINPLRISDNKIEYIAAGWMLKYPKEQVLHNHKELLSKSIGIMLSKENNYDKLIISHYITSLQEHYGITAKSIILEEDRNYRYYMLVENGK